MELSNNEKAEIRFGRSLFLNVTGFFTATGVQLWLAVTKIAPLSAEDPTRKNLFWLLGISFITTILATAYNFYAARQQYVWELINPKRSL